MGDRADKMRREKIVRSTGLLTYNHKVSAAQRFCHSGLDPESKISSGRRRPDLQITTTNTRVSGNLVTHSLLWDRVGIIIVGTAGVPTYENGTYCICPRCK